VLGALAAHPDRLRGTAIVAPDITPETLAEMARAGIVGIPQLVPAMHCRMSSALTIADCSETCAQRWQVEIYLEGATAGVLLRARAGARRSSIILDRLINPRRAVRRLSRSAEVVRAGGHLGQAVRAHRLAAPIRNAMSMRCGCRRAAQLVWASDWPSSVTKKPSRINSASTGSLHGSLTRRHAASSPPTRRHRCSVSVRAVETPALCRN
jgi:hypothetical protein